MSDASNKSPNASLIGGVIGGVAAGLLVVGVAVSLWWSRRGVSRPRMAVQGQSEGGEAQRGREPVPGSEKEMEDGSRDVIPIGNLACISESTNQAEPQKG